MINQKGDSDLQRYCRDSARCCACSRCVTFFFHPVQQNSQERFSGWMARGKENRDERGSCRVRAPADLDGLNWYQYVHLGGLMAVAIMRESEAVTE